MSRSGSDNLRSPATTLALSARAAPPAAIVAPLVALFSPDALAFDPTLDKLPPSPSTGVAIPIPPSGSL